jgi:hypothetical protein
MHHLRACIGCLHRSNCSGITVSGFVLHDSQTTPIATVASWSKQAERKRRARLGLRGSRETGSGRRRVSAVTSQRCDAGLQGLP